MKTIIFDGRVGAKGTEVKKTTTGKTYARFSVANNNFVNGEEKTDWYDVITYDPTFIEKRAQYLGKGSYVIVTGSIRTEVRPDQTGKVWVNHYVTATNIDTPRLGGKPEGGQVSETTVIPSTFTAGTKSDSSVAAPQVQVQPQVAMSPNGSVNSSANDVDDLPF